MKKGLIFSFALLLLLSSCNNKKNTPPEQDTDVTHAQDVMFANSFVADLACIVLQSNNGGVYMPTYSKFSGTLATTDVSININTSTGITNIDFNKVVCADGIYRSGKIKVSASPVNTLSMPKFPGYTGTVEVQPGFVVKNYSVNTVGNFIVKNITPNGFNPSQTKMQWEISGELNFIDTSASVTNKNMTWKGKFIMTMANSTNTLLNSTPGGFFDFYLPAYSPTMSAFPTPTNGILLQFTGSANGKVKTSMNYTFTTRSGSSIEKDFNKTPNYSLAFRRHPFVAGKAELKIEGKPIRYIDLGEGNPDETGYVQINGLSYSFDFTY
ncbi:MAG: hypothetical protein N3F09_03655 [Bacteroidia bacterium]|nr:hypothetical protein [Bacteroidia bacterium]